MAPGLAPTPYWVKMAEESVLSRQESQHADMRLWFYKELSRVPADTAKNCVFLMEATYEKLVNNVKKTTMREPWDYWLLKRYKVMVVENNQQSKLIYPVKEGVSAIQFYIRDSVF